MRIATHSKKHAQIKLDQFPNVFAHEMKTKSPPGLGGIDLKCCQDHLHQANSFQNTQTHQTWSREILVGEMVGPKVLWLVTIYFSQWAVKHAVYPIQLGSITEMHCSTGKNRIDVPPFCTMKLWTEFHVWNHLHGLWLQNISFAWFDHLEQVSWIAIH